MIKFFLPVLLLTFCQVHSQVQFNAVGSIIKGAGYSDNHSILSGGGMSMRYMIKEKFFIGGTIRTYHGTTTAYTLYNASDKVNNISGTVDYVFSSRNHIQPYIGIGAGVSNSTRMINYMRTNKSFTIYQARAGTHVTIGKSTGFFAQVEYNYSPGNGSPSPFDGIINPVLTEPVSKYLAFDCGLFLRLYMAK
jgi:hypothetical protein